eukprot:GHVQ01030368.1.p1 GENE.GHVQ01030368.1~~GHVQ01030368.1.p1  ORF type:complete len:176 (+),score=30.88 GHVQ01030368.1:344-871(+)
MSKMMMSNSINNDDDINLESRQKRKNTHIYVVGWDMVNVFTLRLLIAIWGIFGVDEAHKSESSAGRPRTENENPSPPPGGRNRRLGPTAGHADIFWGSEAGQLGGEKNSKQSLYVSLVNLLSSLWSRGICGVEGYGTTTSGAGDTTSCAVSVGPTCWCSAGSADGGGGGGGAPYQ